MNVKKICHIMVAPEHYKQPIYLTCSYRGLKAIVLGSILMILICIGVGVGCSMYQYQQVHIYRQTLEDTRQALEDTRQALDLKNGEIETLKSTLEDQQQTVAVGIGGPIEEDVVVPALMPVPRYIPEASDYQEEKEDPYIPDFKPCEGTITSSFGTRQNPFNNTEGDNHKGIDIGASKGTPIYAAAKGIVKEARYMNGYGYAVFIDHQNGIETRYAHTSKLYVETGQEVEKGEKIAAVGSSGNSTGPHLHFEIRENDKVLNPTKLFAKE